MKRMIKDSQEITCKRQISCIAILMQSMYVDLSTLKDVYSLNGALLRAQLQYGVYTDNRLGNSVD